MKFKRIIILILAAALTIMPINIQTIEAGAANTAASYNQKVKKTPELSILNRSNKIRLEASSTSYTDSLSTASMQLRQQLKMHNETITIRYKTTSSAFNQTFKNIWNKAFEITNNSSEGDYLYWTIDKASTSYVSKTAKVKGVKYYYYSFYVDASYFTTTTQETFVDTKVKEIITGFGFNDTTTDYQKIKTIYDYVCENVEYDHGASNIKYTAYSALNYGKSVCQGYAVLMYKMLKEVGISTRVIPGYGMSNSEYHGWNIVKLGDYYYNIDATWDAELIRAGKPKQFFLKGDKFKEHTRHVDYNTAAFYLEHPMAATDYVEGTIAKASPNTVNASFKLLKTKIVSVTRKKIKIKSIAGAKGYQIKYSTEKKFKKKYTKTVSTSKRNYKFKKLKLNKKKTYYFKVRAYKKSNGSKIYTKYSSVKKVKRIKKVKRK